MTRSEKNTIKRNSKRVIVNRYHDTTAVAASQCKVPYVRITDALGKSECDILSSFGGGIFLPTGYELCPEPPNIAKLIISSGEHEFSADGFRKRNQDDPVNPKYVSVEICANDHRYLKLHSEGECKQCAHDAIVNAAKTKQAIRALREAV